MWDAEDIGALRLLELKDAERVSAALRGPDAQLTHLPPGGFGAVRRRDSRRRAAPSSSARGPRPLPLLWVVSGRRHHRLHPVSCGGRRRQAAAEGWSPRSRSLSLRCSSSSRLQALFEVSRPRAKRRAANRSRGLCICGTPATSGYRTCVGCRERAAARRARLRAAGICLRCPAPARPGRCLCARCGAAAVVASSCCSGSRRSGLNERRKRDPGRRRDREPLRPSG